MVAYKITAELDLKKIIAESREVVQAFNELVDNLEQIENKYAGPQEEKSCSNCKSWRLDSNDKNRRCKYCYDQDEWQAESEEISREEIAALLARESMSEEMTREQARDRLRNAAWLGTNEDRERIERAVELLCGEPCEDAISRKWIEGRTYMECPNCHDIWHYEENQTERFKCCPTCGERIK